MGRSNCFCKRKCHERCEEEKEARHGQCPAPTWERTGKAHKVSGGFWKEDSWKSSYWGVWEHAEDGMRQPEAETGVDKKKTHVVSEGISEMVAASHGFSLGSDWSREWPGCWPCSTGTGAHATPLAQLCPVDQSCGCGVSSQQTQGSFSGTATPLDLHLRVWRAGTPRVKGMFTPQALPLSQGRARRAASPLRDN